MSEFLETSQEEKWTSQLPDTDYEPISFLIGAESGHRLFAAILNRAVRDYKQYLWKPESKYSYLAIDAWLWISSDAESRELTTFVDICKLLNQSPDLIRCMIAELVENEGTDRELIPVTNAA